jgi:nucleotide-binding universal stress UspA family protein
MKSEKVLFPIDLAKCPLEAFSLVNSFVDRSRATVVLLHVVNLSILAPENRVYADLCREAELRLERLAREYVNPRVETCLRVRVGSPFKEIVAEAKEQPAALIVLPTFQPASWKRFFAPVVPKVAEKLAREAPCPVLALPVETSFNCEKYWSLGKEVPLPASNGSARKSSLMTSIAALCRNLSLNELSQR